MPKPLLIVKTVDKSRSDFALLPILATRDGCIAGTTKISKPVASQVLAEIFSAVDMPNLIPSQHK